MSEDTALQVDALQARSPTTKSLLQVHVTNQDAEAAHRPVHRWPVDPHMCLKLWQLATLAANRISAAVELKSTGAPGNFPEFTVWKYSYFGQKRVHLYQLQSRKRRTQMHHKRAGLHAFIVNAWKLSQSSKLEALAVESHAAMIGLVQHSALRQQLDLALDNLSGGLVGVVE